MKKHFLTLLLFPFLLVGCGNKTSETPKMNVTFNSQIVTYDGEEHTILATGYPDDSVVNYINAGPFVDIGNYTIGVEITHPKYKTFTGEATLTITTGVINASFEDKTVSYDGNFHTIEATDYPEGSTVSYSNAGPFKEVGNYEIQVTITCDNYETYTNTATLVIDKREMTGVNFSNKTVTYDGMAYTIEATGYPQGSIVTYTNSGPFTEVGTYEIGVKITHPNYKDYTNTAILRINEIDADYASTTTKALLNDHPSKTNLDGQSARMDIGINFLFFKGEGSNNPNYDNSKTSLKLYAKNGVTIEAPLFGDKTALQIVKMVFTCYSADKTPSEATISEGKLSFSETSFSWSGLATNVTLTMNNSAAWITNIDVYYTSNEHMIPSLPGISSIATIKEAAEEIRYIPSNEGWYLTPTEVTVQIEAIDLIDSASTTGTLPGDARGKVVCVDNTGYILISSATSISGRQSFYAAVKEYLKKGTTTYEVHGKLAFLNGVLEINVIQYDYMKGLIIDKDYESYVERSFDLQIDFVNDTIENAKYNPAGYGIGHVVKMSSLTCYNCYNSKGSYLFLDQEGNIVPVYSVENKDRASLSLGQCYDIIGLESAYRFRPSLRIFKVSRSSMPPAVFDLENNVTEVTDLTQFYSIGEGTNEIYVKSELTLYKVDAYVSSYANDKYTFNTKYFSYNDTYTTGSTQQDACNKYSLGIFNENLDYKQTLLDFILNGCSTTEECEERKVTLYFTLAYLDTVSGKNMWRVNLFEDLVKTPEYVSGEKLNMIFSTSQSGVSCEYEDKVYQEWSYSNFKVRNESTIFEKENYQIKRSPTCLIIADGTKLTLTFDKEILGFTLYHTTYSSFAGLIGLNYRCYIQRKDHTEIVLKEPSKIVTIDNVFLTGENYIKISNMELVYKK